MAQDAKPLAHVAELGKLVGRVIRIQATKAGDLHVEAVTLQKTHVGQTTGEGKGLGIGTDGSNCLRQCRIAGRGAITSDAARWRAEFKLHRAGRVSQPVTTWTKRSQQLYIEIIDESERPFFHLLP